MFSLVSYDLLCDDSMKDLQLLKMPQQNLYQSSSETLQMSVFQDKNVVFMPFPYFASLLIELFPQVLRDLTHFWLEF